MLRRWFARLGKLRPWGDAPLVGFAWGLLFGLVDGLPIVLERPAEPFVVQRLWVFYYAVLFYAFLWALILGLVGAAIRVVQHLRKCQPERTRLVAVYSGLAAGTFFLVGVLHRLQTLQAPVQPGDFLGPSTPWQIELLQQPTTAPWSERLLALLLVVPLSVGLGLVVGWASLAAVRQVRQRWAFFNRWSPRARRAVTLILLLVIATPLLGRFLYQSVLRNLPPFHPSTGRLATPEYPNIVLLSIDTLRADHLGAYGYDAGISPHIDALAQRGVVFEQAVSPAPWTYPSFLALHTSLYPSALGFEAIDAVKFSLDSSRNTLAEMLRQNGYHTQAYVTNDWLGTYTGLNQGFDGYGTPRPTESFDPESMQQRQVMLYLVHRYAPFLYRVFEGGYGLLVDPRLPYFNGGERVNAYARLFLRRHHEDRFFLWLHYMEPHATYNPSQPFHALAAEISSERETWLRTVNELDRFRWVLPLLDPASRAALESFYAGEIADVDALVGEIVAELERWGLLDRTVIVVVADHGEEFVEHGGLGHGRTLYQELVHVPLIISGPSVSTPGRHVLVPVEGIDLMPTLLEIAQASIPPEAQGRSLLPLLRGGELDEEPVFSEANYVRFPHWDLRAVQEAGFKLIYNMDRDVAELYDLRMDSGEQRVLVDGVSSVTTKLMGRIRGWAETMAEVAALLERADVMGGIDADAQEVLRNLGY